MTETRDKRHEMGDARYFFVWWEAGGWVVVGRRYGVRWLVWIVGKGLIPDTVSRVEYIIAFAALRRWRVNTNDDAGAQPCLSPFLCVKYRTFLLCFKYCMLPPQLKKWIFFMETSVRYPPSLYVKYRPSTVYLCHVDHPYLSDWEVGLLHEDLRDLSPIPTCEISPIHISVMLTIPISPNEKWVFFMRISVSFFSCFLIIMLRSLILNYLKGTSI